MSNWCASRVLNVKADQIVSFRGRQITPLLAQEVGSQFSSRIAGTCIKHRFGECSIKMYDKHGSVPRIAITTNDVSFKHRRKMEHRQGPASRGLAPVKKSIYSLIDLREILPGSNRRYIAHLSALDDFSAGTRAVERVTKPPEVEGKAVKGINFFAPMDKAQLHALQNPWGHIADLRRGDLLPGLGMLSPTRLSPQLRRLLHLRVIKRATGTLPLLPKTACPSCRWLVPFAEDRLALREQPSLAQYGASHLQDGHAVLPCTSVVPSGRSHGTALSQEQRNVPQAETEHVV